jgi:hypothetical protein
MSATFTVSAIGVLVAAVLATVVMRNTKPEPAAAPAQEHELVAWPWREGRPPRAGLPGCRSAAPEPARASHDREDFIVCADYESFVVIDSRLSDPRGAAVAAYQQLKSIYA